MVFFIQLFFGAIKPELIVECNDGVYFHNSINHWSKKPHSAISVVAVGILVSHALEKNFFCIAQPKNYEKVYSSSILARGSELFRYAFDN